MIQLNDISKSFAGKTVLERISLSLDSGQTHVLLGSSGCGKSTLLRLILGLVPPDHGSIFLDDLAVTKGTKGEIARRVGYVVQEGGLFPHLTAAENATLPAQAQGWPKARIKERMETLTRFMDLDSSLLKRYPKELSGGQRQRVGLIRALVLDPALLLLDEPLGALDPIVRSHLQNELKRVFNSVRKTVVLVTHDLGEAAFFGHTITLLHEGKIVQHGSFGTLARNPASPFVTEFLHAQRPLKELTEYL